jgi:hypothetical protein
MLAITNKYTIEEEATLNNRDPKKVGRLGS